MGTRYRLLETLRQYGEDQMELRLETASVRDRHATSYADLIAELDLLSRGARQIEGEARMSINGTTWVPRTCGRWHKASSTTIHFGPPKTNASVRSVPVLSFCDLRWKARTSAAHEVGGDRQM